MRFVLGVLLLLMLGMVACSGKSGDGVVNEDRERVAKNFPIGCFNLIKLPHSGSSTFQWYTFELEIDGKIHKFLCRVCPNGFYGDLLVEISK